MLNIRDRYLGDGHSTFITFEAGPTHQGVESAKRLIRHAAQAGADAIKFQFSDADYSVPDKSLVIEYKVLKDRNTGETETVRESMYDAVKRRVLKDDEWREVKKCADEYNLKFFATINKEETIGLLQEIGADSIKIASGDINHIPLIRSAAKSQMVIQLDTGNATIGEIEKAVDAIRLENNDRIIIHHCPSGYPAHLESINLRIIPTLKRMFDAYPIGFSDHTPGWEMDIAAVALGANLIEKTITEDRTTRAIEHIMSIEPHEFKSFIGSIRFLEVALGKNRRLMHPEEIKKRVNVRRSAILAEDVSKGTPLCKAKINFSRPGDGVSPDLFDMLKDAAFKYDLPRNHKLQLTDIE